MTDATPILPGLSPVEGKSLTATFDAGRLSSDGGVIVLREAASVWGWPRRSRHRSATTAIRHAFSTATPRWRWRGCS